MLLGHGWPQPTKVFNLPTENHGGPAFQRATAQSTVKGALFWCRSKWSQRLCGNSRGSFGIALSSLIVPPVRYATCLCLPAIRLRLLLMLPRVHGSTGGQEWAWLAAFDKAIDNKLHLVSGRVLSVCSALKPALALHADLSARLLDALLPARLVEACLLDSRRACQLAAARDRQAAVRELLPVELCRRCSDQKLTTALWRATLLSLQFQCHWTPSSECMRLEACL